MAAPQQWNGQWQDSYFGGSLHVCVTMHNGVNYAQGVFSHAGYMRGTIDNRNQWKGSYYLAGSDERGGKFSLNLDRKSNMRGYFTEWGNFAQVPVNNKNIDRDVPDDIDCFRSAAPLLDKKGHHSIGGMYNGGVDNWMIYSDSVLKTVNSSYSYLPEGWTSDQLGYEVGNYHLRGQVTQTSFYEKSSAKGIDLIVARDENSIYSTYLNIPSLSSFNISSTTGETIVSQRAQGFKPFNGDMGDLKGANRNLCMIFDSSPLESFCDQASKAAFAGPQ